MNAHAKIWLLLAALAFANLAIFASNELHEALDPILKALAGS